MADRLIDLAQVDANLLKAYGVKVEFIVNDTFLSRLKELRTYAASKTEELKCPVLRLLQLEELLMRHVKRTASRAAPEVLSI